MSEHNLKRKNRDSDSESEKNKKPRMDIDYTSLQKQMNKLHEKIKSYSSIINKGNTISSVILKELQNSMHRVVVCGNQSSGKSALIKNITKSDRCVSTGLGTRCPIEYSISPLHIEPKVYIGIRGATKEFANITAAEEYIKSHLHDKEYIIDGKFFNGRIVQEVYDENTALNFIDLPGYNSDPTLSSYYDDFSKHYFESPNTTIIHVMKGDTDPAIDMAINHIKNTKNDVITVLTHIDVWKYDKKKEENLPLVCNLPHVKIVFLTSAEKDDIATSIDLSNGHFTKPVKKGIEQLINHIMQLTDIKLKEFVPKAKYLCSEASKCLEDDLSNIGFSFDIKDILIRFRLDMTKNINKEFAASGTDFSTESNKIKSGMDSNIIKNFFKKITMKDLVNELKNGSRRQVKGSEGWNDVVVKYIKNMIENVKKDIIPQFFKEYIHALEKVTESLLSKNYRPCTLEREKEILGEAKKYLYELRGEFIKKLEHDLDMTSTDPYVHWEQYATQYMIDTYTPFAKNMMEVKYVYEGDITTLVAAVVKNMGTDPYTFKATSAFNQIKNIWDVESNSINNQIITHASSMERKYEDHLVTLIQRTEDFQLKEDESVNVKRNALKELIDCCKNIIETVK